MTDPTLPPFVKIAPDVVLGTNVRLSSFINLYGCAIGAHSMIGAFVEIQRDVRVGEHCRVQSHSFLCSGVALEDYVFIGHGAMFINDSRSTSIPSWRLPPSITSRSWKTRRRLMAPPGRTVASAARWV
jgi:UDP-3-O-[3-hydroxymyristoyl] glucosamine N-acyltransferase